MIERAVASDNPYTAIALTLVHTSLQRGERIRLPVSGFSMAPLLQPGDVVWMEQSDPGVLSRGAIVVVYHGGCLLTHRLVAVDAQGWHTKGDNNPQADSPVAGEAIQGRIVTIERSGTSIDMQRQPWPSVNWLLGQLGWLQIRSAHARLYWLRRSPRAFERLLTYLEVVSFRLVVRALVAGALRCSTGRSC